MSIKNYITKTLIKKLAQVAFDELIYPMAQAYVKKTTNTHDDKALEFLKGLIDDFVLEIEAEEKKPIAKEG